MLSRPFRTVLLAAAAAAFLVSSDARAQTRLRAKSRGIYSNR